MEFKKDHNFLSASNKSYIEGLYQTFLEDPMSLDDTWKSFFQGFEYGNSDGSETGEIDANKMNKEFNVFRLIQSYRARGHLLSHTNPIRVRIDRDARLTLVAYGLEEADLEQRFVISKVLKLNNATLKEIIAHLTKLYCGHIGIEYMHITDTNMRRWIRDKYESEAGGINFSVDKKKHILKKLNEAVIFENFLQTKYIGQKRFSLEGGETTIPALNAIIEHGAELGIKDFVFGMAHRGRLNVLANIIGKTYEFIFDEFEGGKTAQGGEDDVKYHLGFTSQQKTQAGKDVTLKIMHNPSHLEAVGVTTNGFCRAVQDIDNQKGSSECLPIVIHGDAAVAGQGIVYESAQMSKLKSYQVGGTIHFVINNQIGFTTDFLDARSSTYCTSVAKVIDAPVLHVNGDDPEAVVFACELAVEFRQTFKQDIFIDMVCYRKHGHNEGDEPKYTQPHLYGLVAKHKNPRDMYIDFLKNQNREMEDLADEMEAKFKSDLQDRFNSVKQKSLPKKLKGPYQEWANLGTSKPKDFDSSPKTGVKKEILQKIIQKISSAPEGFNVLRKATKILDERKKRFDNDQIDWALAEMFAFGSLLLEGHRVRFSGQDVIRGTFSHRHAKIFDERTNEAYCGINDIEEGQGDFSIYNSLLSEYAVLGFEFGYSLGSPKSLNIWEAQFGDFANGAQIIIDQFIASSEAKWKRMSGLVLLLPHGHEGQGPEHSSARPERFLQLAAQENYIVANCTTPANLFHIFRRQLQWKFRKPLILFTPKSLLRHAKCVSPVGDFTKGSFQEVIDDSYVTKTKVKKVVFCHGKLFYDLVEKQAAEKRKDVAIVRLEQLYPLPEKKINEVIKKYGKAKFIWVQEEPKNMGAISFLKRYELFDSFEFISRVASASPATGFATTHKLEQDEILKQAFS
ncbi:2-oxoglutarate dehydrogenase E1 component [Bacteriovoracaceae bacterium]|nr:2-oxoglutarate dehydrogenase E1 component [Bacteriovoracaceae bacterium]